MPGERLVPGHIIEIKSMTLMQCDAVLLNGNVIVNESILTGESVPVTKYALGVYSGVEMAFKHGKLNAKDHSRHILFSGTQVIQTRYYGKEKLKAIVIRTGFNTTKGELIRSILHPKPVDFQFNNDTYKYVAGLSIIAIIGMAYSLILKIRRGNPVAEIIKRSLDVITVCVPPALPGALTACLAYAQNRLKKKDIYCIRPSSINLCGTLNTIVFDKTGTLTEDGLDLKYVLPANQQVNSFGKLIKHALEFEANSSKLLRAMATCHSLTYIHGELAGDPLDLKMFEFTGWDFIEFSPNETENYDKMSPAVVRPRKCGEESSAADSLASLPLIDNNNANNSNAYCDESSVEIGIIRHFPFSSSLQRMSVIAKTLNASHFDLFTKGSPEKICELTKKETSELKTFFFFILTNAIQYFMYVPVINWQSKIKYQVNSKIIFRL